MKDDRFPHDPSLTATFTPASRQKFLEGLDKYFPYLKDIDATDEQKCELLMALWSIVASWVDYGFRVHPVQEVCGKPENDGALAAKAGGDGVNCEATTGSKPFDDAPDRE